MPYGEPRYRQVLDHGKLNLEARVRHSVRVAAAGADGAPRLADQIVLDTDRSRWPGGARMARRRRHIKARRALGELPASAEAFGRDGKDAARQSLLPYRMSPSKDGLIGRDLDELFLEASKSVPPLAV